MTDPTPTDDELVAAYLDGEATPAEIARIEGDVALRARADELRSAQVVAATPVTPLAADDVDRIVAAALDAAAVGAAPPATESGIVDLDVARRRRPERWRTIAAVAAAALLLALAVPLIGALDLGGDDETDDVAIEAGDDRTAAPAADDASSEFDLSASPEAAEAAPLDDDNAARAEDGDSADGDTSPSTTFSAGLGVGILADLQAAVDPEELADQVRARLDDLAGVEETTGDAVTARAVVGDLTCGAELLARADDAVILAAGWVEVDGVASEALVLDLGEGERILAVTPRQTCVPVVVVPL